MLKHLTTKFQFIGITVKERFANHFIAHIGYTFSDTHTHSHTFRHTNTQLHNSDVRRSTTLIPPFHYIYGNNKK